MSAKRAAPVDVRRLAIRDNVPAGAVVSLDSLPAALSFASLFRDELQARGIGAAKREARDGRKRLG